MDTIHMKQDIDGEVRVIEVPAAAEAVHAAGGWLKLSKAEASELDKKAAEDTRRLEDELTAAGRAAQQPPPAPEPPPGPPKKEK